MATTFRLHIINAVKLTISDFKNDKEHIFASHIFAYLEE